MESPFAVLSVALNSCKLLHEEIEKYSRRKKIKAQLFRALSKEIEDFASTFDEIYEVSETKLLPSIDSFEMGDSSIPKINTIVESVSDILLSCSKMTEYFVNLAVACKSLSTNIAFMKELMATNEFLHDFVNQMGLMVTTKNKLTVDNKFLYFVKLHEGEIFKKIRDKDIDEAVKAIRDYVDIINKRIKPSITKSVIRRSTAKKFVETLKKIGKTNQKIKISKPLLKNLSQYIPQRFYPIAVLIEELFPFETDKERLQSQKYLRKRHR